MVQQLTTRHLPERRPGNGHFAVPMCGAPCPFVIAGRATVLCGKCAGLFRWRFGYPAVAA